MMPLRLVVGRPMAYDLYRMRFEFSRGDAVLVASPHRLRGLRPPAVLLVLLPGWQDAARDHFGLYTGILEFRSRWHPLGVDELTEDDLAAGIPGRRARLLVEYDRRVEEAARNGLAWEAARDWLKLLDDRDAAYLTQAIDGRKQERIEGEKIILEWLDRSRE